ncbi:MAG: hypothetical protein AAGN35_21685 [Bacteroidota bacterium]
MKKFNYVSIPILLVCFVFAGDVWPDNSVKLRDAFVRRKVSAPALTAACPVLAPAPWDTYWLEVTTDTVGGSLHSVIRQRASHPLNAQQRVKFMLVALPEGLAAGNVDSLQHNQEYVETALIWDLPEGSYLFLFLRQDLPQPNWQDTVPIMELAPQEDLLERELNLLPTLILVEENLD